MSARVGAIHNANVCIATHAHRSCQIMRLYELYNNKLNVIGIGRRATTVDKNKWLLHATVCTLAVHWLVTRASLFSIIYSTFFCKYDNECVDCLLFILIMFVPVPPDIKLSCVCVPIVQPPFHEHFTQYDNDNNYVVVGKCILGICSYIL